MLKIKNQKGFSLIELMIVVAIIGILSAVAIPNYIRFQQKARQSEAKELMGAVFTAEKAYYAEYTTYCGKFDAIGFKPEGQLTYNVGFAADGANCAIAPAPQGTAGCNQSGIAIGNDGGTACTANPSYNNAWGVLGNSSGGAYAQALTAAVAPTSTTFKVAASARICQNCGNNDEWTMDQVKALVYVPVAPASGID